MAARTCGKGFTLIELLVVIAIIAILAAILFPVFARAKKSAQLNVCMYNMKQWTNATIMYVDDNQGRFPYAGADLYYAHKPPLNIKGVPEPEGYGGSTTGYEALAKYVKKAEGLKWCPATVGSNPSASWKRMGWSYWYMCPHNEFGKRYPDSALCGYAMTDVTRPAKKPCIIELDSSCHSIGDRLYAANRGYCDGHVKSWQVDYAGCIRTGYVGRNGVEPTQVY